MSSNHKLFHADNFLSWRSHDITVFRAVRAMSVADLLRYRFRVKNIWISCFSRFRSMTKIVPASRHKLRATFSSLYLPSVTTANEDR